jgi:hypothetical protein
VLKLKVNIVAKPFPPGGFLGRSREGQEFGLGGGRSDGPLLPGSPVDRGAEELEEIAFRAPSGCGVVGIGCIARGFKADLDVLFLGRVGLGSGRTFLNERFEEGSGGTW